MASILYWIAHPTSSFGSNPTGAQIAAGNLQSGSAADRSGSEGSLDTTAGTRNIDEATAPTELTAGVSYTIAGVIFNTVAGTYSPVAVGTVTTDMVTLSAPTVTAVTATTATPRVTATGQAGSGDVIVVIYLASLGSVISAAQVAGSLDPTNTPALYSVVQTPQGPGVITFPEGPTNLTPNTAYRAAYLWFDGLTESNVVVSEPFSTLRSAILGIPTFVPGSLTSGGFRPRFPVTWA